MTRKISILSAALFAAATIAAAGSASGAPLQAAGSAIPEKTFAIGEGDASDGLIVKTQGRRGGGRVAGGGGRVGGGRVIGGGRVGGGRVVGGRGFRGGGGWGGGRRGFDPGAAAAVGIIGGVLGAMGAAAAADSGYYYPAPAPVYGGCYWARQPMYDDWGNYLGRRRVQICN